MSEHHSESTATPVAATERIASLDVLRGVAILGILVMNIYAFAMPFPAYSNPLLMGGTDTLNIGTWFFTHILFDQKFMSIFAMLFGAGIILMTGRAEAKGAKYGRIFYRRQLWLVVLGALHAYLFWFGDILFLYAVVGMLAYLFRNRRPRTLIVIACVLLPVVVLMSYGTGFFHAKAAEQGCRSTCAGRGRRRGVGRAAGSSGQVGRAAADDGAGCRNHSARRRHSPRQLCRDCSAAYSAGDDDAGIHGRVFRLAGAGANAARYGIDENRRAVGAAH